MKSGTLFIITAIVIVLSLFAFSPICFRIVSLQKIKQSNLLHDRGKVKPTHYQLMKHEGATNTTHHPHYQFAIPSFCSINQIGKRQFEIVRFSKDRVACFSFVPVYHQLDLWEVKSDIQIENTMPITISDAIQMDTVEFANWVGLYLCKAGRTIGFNKVFSLENVNILALVMVGEHAKDNQTVYGNICSKRHPYGVGFYLTISNNNSSVLNEILLLMLSTFEFCPDPLICYPSMILLL